MIGEGLYSPLPIVPAAGKGVFFSRAGRDFLSEVIVALEAMECKQLSTKRLWHNDGPHVGLMCIMGAFALHRGMNVRINASASSDQIALHLSLDPAMVQYLLTENDAFRFRFQEPAARYKRMYKLCIDLRAEIQHCLEVEEDFAKLCR